jgi:hypothetical protein
MICATSQFQPLEIAVLNFAGLARPEGDATAAERLAVDREEAMKPRGLFLLTVGLQNVAAGLLQFFPVVLQAGEHAKCVRESITTISDGVRTTCSLFLGCAGK